MKRILSSIVVALVATTLLAAPASADTYEQVCVRDYDGTWFAFAIESDADRAWIGAREVQPFPNTALGCSSYGPVKGATPPSDVPSDAPSCVPLTIVQLVRDDTLIDELRAQSAANVSTIAKQRATIAQLRAKIRALKAAQR